MNPANRTVEEIADRCIDKWERDSNRWQSVKVKRVEFLAAMSDDIADALRAEREQAMLTPAFLSQMAASAEDCKKEDLEKIRATILHFVHVVTVQDNELRAQLAAERERGESKWLPIESAPQDGTYILIAGKYKGPSWVSCARWTDDGWYEINLDASDMHGRPDYPTHWQALPAKPEVEE